MGNLGKLTLSAAVGLVLGIMAVIWIEPDNAGGTVLVIVFCTAIAIIVGAVVKALRGG